MTRTCTVVILNEVFSQVVGLDHTTLNKCINQLKYLVPWRFHTPSYKLGRWDGSIRLFANNGRVYSSLLPDILGIIADAGYSFEFEDNRTHGTIEVPKIGMDIFADHVWPKGHKLEGEPIMLREDQMEAANIFAENRYAIQELSTGYGKCLGFHTLVPVYCEDEELASVLNIKPNKKEDIEIGFLVRTLNEQENYTPQEVSQAIFAYTPDNTKTKINYVIEKFEPCLEITFEDGTKIICADEHIFQFKGKPIRAMDVGSKMSIDANLFSREKKIESILSIDRQPVFDISVDAPHWYVDSNDIIHHNTILTAAICKQVEHIGRTLTIVPNKSLVTQTCNTMKLVGMDVSMYFSEAKDVSAHHVITTWQSLERLEKDKNKKPEAREMLNGIKYNLMQLIVDECHGAKSAVLDKLLSNEFANVPLRRGFTGTMPPEEYFTKTVVGNIGEIVHRVAARDLQEQGFLANCFVHGLVFQEDRVFSDYHEEHNYLTENIKRLDTLVDPIKAIAKSGNTLVLVSRITTGEYLTSIIDGALFVNGNTSLKERERIYDLARDNDGLVIIATYGVAAVGIDIPRLYNVALFEAGKSFIRIIQSVGRGLRTAKDKKFADIWDLSATAKFSKKHFKDRKTYYAAADYPYSEYVGNSDDIVKYIEEQADEGQSGQS